MGKQSKGSAFEREICKTLSLWWTDMESDDVFWRSNTSGARATSRSKKGLKTFGQCGDITATDPIGQPLIDLITFEIKRGYPKASVHDMLDKATTFGAQEWEKFYTQVRTSQIEADTPYWAIITKRDRRKPIIWLPAELLDNLAEIGSTSHLKFSLFLEGPRKIEFPEVVGLAFDTFLEYVWPENIIDLLKDMGMR